MDIGDCQVFYVSDAAIEDAIYSNQFATMLCDMRQAHIHSRLEEHISRITEVVKRRTGSNLLHWLIWIDYAKARILAEAAIALESRNAASGAKPDVFNTKKRQWEKAK